MTDFTRLCLSTHNVSSLPKMLMVHRATKVQFWSSVPWCCGLTPASNSAPHKCSFTPAVEVQNPKYSFIGAIGIVKEVNSIPAQTTMVSKIL